MCKMEKATFDYIMTYYVPVFDCWESSHDLLFLLFLVNGFVWFKRLLLHRSMVTFIILQMIGKPKGQLINHRS